MKTKILSNKLFLSLSILAIVALAFGVQQVLASPNNTPAAEPSPMHPTFAMLDANGENVLTSGQSVSTMKTCGACHDTDFIESHSFHADLGLSTYAPTVDNWNASAGVFGKWDPLIYRYLSQTGDERIDMTTSEWLMTYGDRIPGGGPATTSRSGTPLTSLNASSSNPENTIMDSRTGKLAAWNWQQSGVMEMDCFLCHLERPNNDARAAELKAGKFGWANTATLLGSGLLEKSADGYQWNANAFDENGNLKEEFVFVQEPTNDNCAQCHGEIHTGVQDPLTISACDLDYPQTATTGQLVASQKISESGVNLENKASLTQPWDIHAERALKCTDCHFSLNNPVQAERSAEVNPSHLTYDPRKLGIGEYLQRPNHDFARGQSAQFTVSPDNKGTMRRCESCHDAQITHAGWLPYTEQHMSVVACESCHIPQMYAPAIQSYDWTVIHADGTPQSTCRGIEGGTDTVTNLVTGYKPVLMQRTNIDGQKLLAPYNLISTWYWVYDDANGNARPVREIDLKAAYLTDGTYDAEIVSVFDANGDGKIDSNELKIDSESKKSAVVAQLEKLGLQNLRIEGQVQPYSINHNVARGEYATSDCQTCHSSDSRVTQPMELAAYAPAGVMPQFVSDSNVNATGKIITAASGALYYTPVTREDGLYVFGRDRISWIDWTGAILFLGVIIGVGGHSTLRYVSSLRNPKGDAKVKKVYMYDSYERFWHWLQTLTVVLLLFTGLIIHRPDIFGVFSFPHIVTVHNVLAVILLLNAALSLFWHLTTGKIHQYIPRPRGFIDDGIVQARYYISGIFKNEPHPFEKKPEQKLNPLQQVTYFGLLNVLLPLLGLTGILMWSVQIWPQITNWFGGLPVLAPIHSLLAWLFAAFIIGHVYLTTTGATPLESMRGMVTGWEEIEVHQNGNQPGEETAPDSPESEK
jgi:thiosulfate reductase cytochrome b subunit